MKKKLIIIGFFASSIMVSILFIGLWYEESIEKVKKIWKVELLLINKKDTREEFSRLRFALMSNNEAILPRFINFKAPYPTKYSYWRYQRKGLFNGQVIIEDKIQNYFSGIYEIQILNHRRPQLMRLYSDSIEFYLREQYFTLGNPTIELGSGLNGK